MNLQEILTTPLGYPSLSQTVFPGDRVLLVPDTEEQTVLKLLQKKLPDGVRILFH